ncbi:hypothetical protein ACM16X_02735 [Haloarcula japonica]|uniref:hypothetical protein n=1 Tax=Haloarcula japonica TaxID=29282 RepID=UPI0039F73DB7
MVSRVSDQIESQIFRVGEDWTKRDKRKKENIFNQVFKDRPLALRKAREGMDALQDARSEDADTIGYLYWLAYDTVNAAVNQARISDDDSVEKLEELRKEFEEALDLGDVKLSPYEVKKLSRKSKKIRRTPARLRRLMEEKGEKIHQLIGFAYAGTEAVQMGAGNEDESPSISDQG